MENDFLLSFIRTMPLNQNDIPKVDKTFSHFCIIYTKSKRKVDKKMLAD